MAPSWPSSKTSSPPGRGRRRRRRKNPPQALSYKGGGALNQPWSAFVLAIGGGGERGGKGSGRSHTRLCWPLHRKQISGHKKGVGGRGPQPGEEGEVCNVGRSGWWVGWRRPGPVLLAAALWLLPLRSHDPRARGDLLGWSGGFPSPPPFFCNRQKSWLRSTR